MNRASETWDTIKHNNKCIIGVLERKEKVEERIFHKIMTKNSPNSLKIINLHIQEAQPNPWRINSKRFIARHTKSKLLKDKEIQSQSSKKQLNTYKKISIRLIVDFSSETMEATNSRMVYSNYWQGGKKSYQAKVLYLEKLSLSHFQINKT